MRSRDVSFADSGAMNKCEVIFEDHVNPDIPSVDYITKQLACLRVTTSH